MSEEEWEVVELLELLIQEDILFKFEKEDAKKLLKLINELNMEQAKAKTERDILLEELEKKDKIIDEIANYIYIDDLEKNDNINLCDFLGKSVSNCFFDKDEKCENCIKQYFEKKVESEE